jgi:hypothetical protein
MAFPADGKNQPALRDIAFVMLFAKKAKSTPTLLGRQRRKYQERYLK